MPRSLRPLSFNNMLLLAPLLQTALQAQDRHEKAEVQIAVQTGM